MILVVEDHEETRWVLLRLLERRGLQAFGVADGAAALQFLREQPPPALIVLDKGLPHVDGLSVLRSIRGDPRHRETPVILYTAAGSGAVVEEALRLGAEVVAKCGDWAVLLDAIDRHTKSPRDPLAPTAKPPTRPAVGDAERGP